MSARKTIAHPRWSRSRR